MTMKLMLNKLENIEEGVVDLRVKVSAIEEHLKTLNGKVLKNQNDIECNRSDILKLNTMAYKAAGALAIIVIIAQIIMGVIL